MGEKITYDYFYGGQLEAFSYYRLPRVLVTGQQFRGLSTDAKLLYALLLDRMGLSSRNGWYDEQGRVYIYYPVEEIEEDIGCGHGKAVRLLAELDSAKGIGLIERVRQGQGRPTKIFVKQFTTVEVPDFPCPPPPTGGEPMPTSTKMGCQEVPKADGQKYQTHTSGLPKTGSLDVPKSNGNYNNINYPYESYLDLSIHPSYRLPVNETDRRAVLAELRENIDYPHLAARYGPEEVDELLELLTDTLCGTRPTIRVGSEEISAAAVKDRFWRLERHHMEYVLDRMRENKFIIAFQKAPVNDVEDVLFVFHPILADKLGGDAFKLFRQVVFRRRAKLLSEGLGHRRLMLRPKLPQEGVAGIFPQAGVGNVEHIPKPGLFAGIVHKGDALGAAPHIPAHGVVPEVIFRTGRCVRALGEDHKLLVEGVLIQPGGGGEKCCPPLPAIRQVGGGVAGHRRIKFQVTHHSRLPRGAARWQGQSRHTL